MLYLPLQNPNKPFSYKGNWYNRNEVISMGLDKLAHEAILSS